METRAQDVAVHIKESIFCPNLNNKGERMANLVQSINF